MKIGFIALIENLVGFEFQNLHLYEVVYEVLTHLSKFTDFFFSTKISVDIFFLCIKLSDNALQKYFPFPRNLKGGNWKNATCIGCSF